MDITETLLLDDSDNKSDKRENISDSNSNNKIIPPLDNAKHIGTFDEWNRRRFEDLQANTKQRLDEYNAMLSKYQNQLDPFLGKSSEKKVEGKVESEYIISVNEKVFSVKEYDTWSQKNFDKLKASVEKQFNEIGWLLEQKRIQLEKYTKEGEVKGIQIDEKKKNPQEIKENLSVVDEIKQYINNLVDKLTKKDEGANKEVKEYEPKPLRELFWFKKKKGWKRVNLKNWIGIIIVIIAIVLILW